MLSVPCHRVRVAKIFRNTGRMEERFTCSFSKSKNYRFSLASSLISLAISGNYARIWRKSDLERVSRSHLEAAIAFSVRDSWVSINLHLWEWRFRRSVSQWGSCDRASQIEWRRLLCLRGWNSLGSELRLTFIRNIALPVEDFKLREGNALEERKHAPDEVPVLKWLLIPLNWRGRRRLALLSEDLQLLDHMAVGVAHHLSFERGRERVDDLALLESVVLVLQVMHNVSSQPISQHFGDLVNCHEPL